MNYNMVNCQWCGRRRKTTDFRTIVINGETRVTCSCIEDFTNEELDSFSAWLRRGE